MDRRTGEGRAAGGERRPAAGGNRGLGRRRASQNRDVTPAAWLTRADGRAGGYKATSNPAAELHDGLFSLIIIS